MDEMQSLIVKTFKIKELVDFLVQLFVMIDDGRMEKTHLVRLKSLPTDIVKPKSDAICISAAGFGEQAGARVRPRNHVQVVEHVYCCSDAMCRGC